MNESIHQKQLPEGSLTPEQKKLLDELLSVTGPIRIRTAPFSAFYGSCVPPKEGEK